METDLLVELFEKVRDGALCPEDAAREAAALSTRPVEHFARLDAERLRRTGIPEAVFAEGKTAAECARLAQELDRLGQPVLVTRLEASKASAVLEAVPDGRYHERARLFAKARGKDPRSLRGPVAVVCAGTSDLPYAEEAALTVETLGQPVERLYDVGVAGLHRLLESAPALRRAGVCVVAAGMEGALPTVVGGLVDVPVVAVPTPVGYGASRGGLAALLAMLSSCAPNVTVVNIGNGFGAGVVAALANRLERKQG